MMACSRDRTSLAIHGVALAILLGLQTLLMGIALGGWKIVAQGQLPAVFATMILLMLVVTVSPFVCGRMRQKRRSLREQDIGDLRLSSPPLQAEEGLGLEALCPSAPADREGGCAICLEAVRVGDPSRQLLCGHPFHLGCIDVWLREQLRHAPEAKCPMCRQGLELSKLSEP